MCNKKISLFNQLKYEKDFHKILKNHVGYNYPILELFYKPILDSKRISALFFIPLWETSVGSRWEYDYAKSLDIKTVILEDLQISRILKEYENISKEIRN